MGPVTVNGIALVPVRGTKGDQGDPGEQGIPGTQGNSYEYLRPSPASVWIIDHMLGRKVHVSIFDPAGLVVHADVEHGTINQTTITYVAPFAGSAVIS